MVKTEGIFLDLENLKILSCVVRNLWVVQRFLSVALTEAIQSRAGTESNQLARVQSAFDLGAKIYNNADYGDDHTSLGTALKSNAPISVIALLLEKGALIRNPDSCNNPFGTTIGMAIDAKNSTKTIEFLLKRGAEILNQPDNKCDILSQAVSKKLPPETIKLLLDNGADATGPFALRQAFGNKNLGITDEVTSNQIIDLLLHRCESSLIEENLKFMVEDYQKATPKTSASEPKVPNNFTKQYEL